ncbi:hypothetical protein BDQ12DRAFT_738093 [Crucibulum laeve]|uniref:G-protein coupled receptors family 1 profile domain-containing protein n=1 Tax=Crucibulum laeve TaxID=68775 RepID=A0A5C3LRP0_9AGAR|nr:hypothetical protein BDQ12DRAFT_738093 [Crucibulum laeve]
MSDSRVGDGSYTITESQINFAGVLAYACTIPGTCVCFLVLVSYAVAAYSPVARRFLDRVSFRLLVYTLIFNVLFGVAYAATPTGPIPGCDVGAFAVNLTLCFSTFFTTCIAINLQLVLVHGINGKRMEMYYVAGTTILSLVLNIPTMALHQFGWNDESATCWYSNADHRIRLQWIIGTQAFWISFAAMIETMCSCIVLLWMYRFYRTTHTMTTAISNCASSQSMSIDQSAATARNDFNFTRFSKSRAISRDPKYRRIILRIALYPVVSLLMNYSTVALDLNMTIRGMNTQLDFDLLVLDLILYGIRTLAYGLLAATDPAFISAIRKMRGIEEQKAMNPESIPSIHFAEGGSDATTSTLLEENKYPVHLELGSISRSNSTQYKLASEDGTQRTEESRTVEVRVTERKYSSGFGSEEEMRDFGRQL